MSVYGYRWTQPEDGEEPILVSDRYGPGLGVARAGYAGAVSEPDVIGSPDFPLTIERGEQGKSHDPE